MRLNITKLSDDTLLDNLNFPILTLSALKNAHITNIGDLLHGFSDRTIFKLLEKNEIRNVAMIICNPKLTSEDKPILPSDTDSDTRAQAKLNAALLLLSRESKSVLDRFSIIIPEQLGYILTKDEWTAVVESSYEEGYKVFDMLDQILKTVYIHIPEEYEVNLRGEFASETYYFEIKEVFPEPIFDKFRMFCDDVGAFWIENLDGFAPNLLKLSIGADDNLIAAVTQRCKELERGDASKIAGHNPLCHKSKNAREAKRQSVARMKDLSGSDSSDSIYGENELTEYCFGDKQCPDYIFDGTPVAFSYCENLYMGYGWQDIFLKIIRFLYYDSPGKFENFIGWQLNADIPAAFYSTDQIDGVRSPKPVSSEIIAETDFNKEDIVAILRALLNECKFPLKEFSVICLCPLRSIAEYLLLTEDCEVDSTSSENADDVENSKVKIFDLSDEDSVRMNKFDDWLFEKKNFSLDKSEKCIEAIEIAGDWARDAGITDVSIFDIQYDEDVVDSCSELMEDIDFLQFDRSKKKVYSKALKLLVEFCTETDTCNRDDRQDKNNADLTRDDINNTPRKMRFEFWLTENQACTFNRTQQYISAINIASEWAVDLALTKVNIFQIPDTYQLIKTCEKLLSNKKFIRFDINSSLLYSDAIDQLIDFCMEDSRYDASNQKSHMCDEEKERTTKNKNADIDIDKAKDNMSTRRVKFENWLVNNKEYEQEEAEKCIAALNIASEWAKDLNVFSKNIFEIKKPDELIEKCELLLRDSDFSRYDSDAGMYYTDSIDMLIDYCMDEE